MPKPTTLKKTDLLSVTDAKNWFLRPNNLKKRWENLTAVGSLFTIGDTDFEVAEKFLASADLWIQSSPPLARLHYIAAQPLPTYAHVHRASLLDRERPGLVYTELAKELLKNCPPCSAGIHNLFFYGGRIRLSLLLGNPPDLFSSLSLGEKAHLDGYLKPSVDTWFINNSDASNHTLFNALAMLSDTTTDFTATSAFKTTDSQMTKAGFIPTASHQVKDSQWVLRGWYIKTTDVKIPQKRANRSLFWHINEQRTKSPSDRHITILGAGIAGCTAASALAQRGYSVTVIDRHEQAGGEGSGNQQAVVYPKISHRNDPLPRINFSAMLHASHFYQPLWRAGIGSQCGVLVLAHTQNIECDQRALDQRLEQQTDWARLIEGEDLYQASGIKLATGCAIFFPKLGWLPPAEVCAHLLQHPNIQMQKAEITQLQRCEKRRAWRLLDAGGNSAATAETLVIANAYGCSQFSQTNFLPIQKVRGQITHLPATSSSQALRTVICGRGYLIPAHKDLHSCGATYDKGLEDLTLRERDHQQNITHLATSDIQLGALFADVDTAYLGGRAQFRCTTQDYLPIVGAVPDVEQMRIDFDDLRRDARSQITATGRYLPNLFVHCGLGSRGLCYAPLTAELLACEIANELPPLELELRLAMHPARFLIRNLKKRRL